MTYGQVAHPNVLGEKSSSALMHGDRRNPRGAKGSYVALGGVAV